MKNTVHTAFPIMHFRKALLLFTLVVLSLGLSGFHNAFAKSLSITLDREEIEMGDVITLIIQTDFQTFDRPDFSILKDQFEVLGSQQSSQVQIVNGNFQAFSRWDVSLLPKQSGTLKIPPFIVENVRSEPYEIKVLPFQPQSAGEKGSSFLESTINTDRVYVQQEVLFTMRFYHLGRFVNGNIRPPVFSDAITKNLRNQHQYRKRINGKVYEVYEWIWAFYPQKSGELTIAPQGFDGRIQYKGRLKAVKDTTEPMQLSVLPKPASYPANAPWLPAKKLTLTEDWQLPNTIRVGDSITRTLNLEVEGLQASQLPDIEVHNQATFHVYPDLSTPSNQTSFSGVVGTKIEKMAIVPTQAGDITLPEVLVHWWNTETDTLETERLAAKKLTVLPAITANNLPLSNIPNAIQDTNVPHETLFDTAVSNTANANTLWQIGFLIMLLLWLTTLLFWYRARQQGSVVVAETSAPVQTPAKNENGLNACNSDLPLEEKSRAVYHAISEWRQAPNHQIDSEIFEQNWQQLKAHLFNQQPISEAQVQQLCDSVKNFKAVTKANAKQNVLQPIYPE